MRIYNRLSPVSVLGPGLRAVIFVQGCGRGCDGCILPQAWDPNGGTEICVPELVDWVLSQEGIEGLTLTGGEPFEQAPAVLDLARELRGAGGLGLVCYTGYTLEEIRDSGNDVWRELLGYIDLLIDGPYIRDRHASLLWRGSDNQRLLALTGRYVEIISRLDPESDVSVGTEFYADGASLGFVGVPATADFIGQFEDRLAKLGIKLETGEDT